MDIIIATAGIEAPNADVQRRLEEAELMVANRADDQYVRITGALKSIIRKWPTHPVKVICLAWLAKIEINQEKYDLAQKALKEALGAAVDLLGWGDAQTLGLVELMAEVTESDLTDRRRESEIDSAVEKVYAGPIAETEKLNLPAVVALLNGDRDFFLERFESASDHYEKAAQLLFGDQEDSNWPRLRERRRDAAMERSALLDWKDSERELRDPPETKDDELGDRFDPGDDSGWDHF